MAVLRQVFLRSVEGRAVGPMPMTALEVLFDARVVDENTPVSDDGEGFRKVQEWPGLLDRLLEVKAALGRNEDPWPKSLDLVEDVPTDDVADSGGNLTRTLILHAGAQSTGTVRIEGSDGSIDIALREGKVVDVVTDAPSLVITEYLLDRGVVDEEKLAIAEANAGSMGGDLGAALVAQGLVEPHVYFEAFVGWAKWVLGHGATGAFGEPRFARSDVPPPTVPLGFDRFSLPAEIVRDAFSLDTLRQRLRPQKRCPLVPSQVERVELEDCKLPPKELRALRKVNGVNTLDNLLTELGGNDERDLALLRAVFFASQAGFIVFGEDVADKRERAEAETLQRVLAAMENQDNFEILGVELKSTDDDVRNRFTDLAKQYHPDKVAADANAALIDVRRRIFARISAAFEQLESEEGRYAYSHELEQGAGPVTSDEQAKLEALKQAELCFQKTPHLINLRKYDEALQNIEQAVELHPSETEFKIQRSYIRYLVAAKDGQGEDVAAKQIKEVLSLLANDANIALGYLVLGHLHKAVHKNDLAARYFEKVLEYDESNPVATQEVRLHNMRKDRGGKKKKGWLS